MGTELYVVETSDDIFLGTIEFVDGGIIVRNGFVGHPKHLDGSEIVRMMPADEHPDIMYSPESVDYIMVG